jgi:hypothetical protein
LRVSMLIRTPYQQTDFIATLSITIIDAQLSSCGSLCQQRRKITSTLKHG